MKSLESLTLSRTEVTDEGLSSWIDHPNLRSLELTFTKITSSGIQQLCKIPNLESIGLYEISDSDLRQLALCHRLRKIKCQGFRQVTDAGIEAIGNLLCLEDLRLAYSEITNSAIEILASLPKLNQLAITDCKINDHAFAAIGKMQQLRKLELSRTGCSDLGLAELSRCSQLDTLIFLLNEGDGVGYKDVESLRKLSNLTIALRHPVTKAIAATSLARSHFKHCESMVRSRMKQFNASALWHRSAAWN